MLGPRIKARRQARGWTLAELGKRSGLHYQTIARVESGETLGPSVQIVKCIAMALECSIDELVRDLRPMTLGQRKMFENERRLDA